MFHSYSIANQNQSFFKKTTIIYLILMKIINLKSVKSENFII